MKTGRGGQQKVLLVGDIMRDVIVRPTGALRRGSDREAAIEQRPGGAASNQAVWLADNGVLSQLVGRVGVDDREQIVDEFAVKGVNAHLAADRERATGMLVSLVTPDGERSFYTDRGANEYLSISDVPQNAFEGVDLLLLSGYSFFAQNPRIVAIELMKEAARLSIPVAVDPASAGFLDDVGVENFLGWTKGVAMIFPNAEEAEKLSGAAEPEAQIRILGENYGLVVVTRGTQGTSAGRKNGPIIHVAASDVEVIDSTGAGDAFVGGFLSAYLAGEELRACMKHGVATGGRAVSQVGGQPVTFK